MTSLFLRYYLLSLRRLFLASTLPYHAHIISLFCLYVLHVNMLERAYTHNHPLFPPHLVLCRVYLPIICLSTYTLLSPAFLCVWSFHSLYLSSVLPSIRFTSHLLLFAP